MYLFILAGLTLSLFITLFLVYFMASLAMGKLLLSFFLLYSSFPPPTFMFYFLSIFLLVLTRGIENETSIIYSSICKQSVVSKIDPHQDDDTHPTIKHLLQGFHVIQLAQQPPSLQIFPKTFMLPPKSIHTSFSGSSAT